VGRRGLLDYKDCVGKREQQVLRVLQVLLVLKGYKGFKENKGKKEIPENRV
jgi:hypothetical protein